MKTKTQAFAELVAADVLGIAPQQIATATADAADSSALEVDKGIDIAAIIALVEAIMEVVMKIMGNCPNQRSDARKAVSKPTFWQRVLVRNQVSQVCDSCAHPSLKRLSGRLSDSLLKRAAMADDLTVFSVFDEVQAVDNWI